LSPSDDNPTINEGYLYPLISDHDSAPVSSEGNTLNQQSGVTFMDPSTGLAEHVHSDPVVTDPKKNEDIVQLHPTSPTSDVARAAGIRSYAWFPVPNAFKGSLNTILESPIFTHTIIFVFCCYVLWIQLYHALQLVSIQCARAFGYIKVEVPEKYTGSYFLLLYDCRLDFPGFVACTWSEVSLVVSQIVSYLVFKSYILTSYICWPSVLSNISLEEAHQTPRQEFDGQNSQLTCKMLCPYH